MSDSCPVNTPMQSTCKLTKTSSSAFPDPYMFRTKHMDIALFNVLHIPGSDQLADVLTKPLASSKFLDLASLAYAYYD
ncbi:hypothetical protein KIW84_045680 [Lathyrus oleraceus]|uniref:Uncharacterized protein n=1 Tax=Pisum sativum TaxID=3888 RepID=A0A9D5AUG4_PEA|nr:hypothetical protein KIW84_045680 [Pisum sativum]